MQKMLFVFIFLVLISCLLFSESPVKNFPPSWLFANERFSMNHAVGFSYSSYDGSLQSLYNNYFTYRISPKLKFIGKVGYYKRDSRTNGLGNMLHGVGFEYKPSPNLLFNFQYEGMLPIKKPLPQEDN